MQKLLTEEERELLGEALYYYSFDQNAEWEEENLPLIKSIRSKLDLSGKR